MTTQGRIALVEESLLGSALTAAAAAGATTITVDDAASFSETGGTLLLRDPDAVLADTVVPYVSADLAADTITLAAGLASAWEPDDLVLVHPSHTERVAYVRLDDDDTEDETLIARVPLSLFDRIPAGTREDGAGEMVIVDYDGSEWAIADVLGQEPVVDGGYIDPETMPPAVGTIQPVDALPDPSTIAAGAHPVVYLKSDEKLYRYDGAEWISTVDGADLVENSVTANKVNVAVLSALAASLGVVNVAGGGALQAGNENTTAGQANYVEVSAAGLQFFVGGNYTPTAAPPAKFYTGGTRLLFADAANANITMRGEFDTSNGGTGTGVWMQGEFIRSYHSGIAVARQYATTLGYELICLHPSLGTTEAILRLLKSGAALLHGVARATLSAGPSDASPSAKVEVDGQTITLAPGASGGVKTGSTGAPKKYEKIVKVTFDPPSVAADTNAAWDIPVPAGTCVATDEAHYIRGLGPGLAWRGTQIIAADSIRLMLRNVHPTLAVDMGATEFCFEVIGL